eukprot:1467496-Amphidinium_carterae.1
MSETTFDWLRFTTELDTYTRAQHTKVCHVMHNCTYFEDEICYRSNLQQPRANDAPVDSTGPQGIPTINNAPTLQRA